MDTGRNLKKIYAGTFPFPLLSFLSLPSPPYPLPSLPPHPLRYVLSRLLSYLPFPSLPLEIDTLKIQLTGLGDRCKLLQWGLGRSPAEIDFGTL